MKFSGRVDPNGTGALFSYLTDILGAGNFVNPIEARYPCTKARTFTRLSCINIDPIPPNESINLNLLRDGIVVATLVLPGGALGAPAYTPFGPLVFVAPYAQNEGFALQADPSAGITPATGLCVTLTGQ